MSDTSSHLRLLSFEVVGGTYFPNLKIDFARGVNAILGERGAGKSTVVDMLRYCLDSTGPAWNTDHEERVRKNLGAGRVRVALATRAGVEYRVERSYGQPPQVFDGGREVHIPIEQLQVDVVGQNELEEIGTTYEAQLALLDGVIAEEMRPLKQQIADVQRELAHEVAAVRRAEEEVKLQRDRAAQAEMIAKDLQQLEAAGPGETPALRAAHTSKGLRERESRAIEQTEAKLERAKDDVRAAFAGVRNLLLRAVDEDILSGPNGEVFKPIVAALQRTLGTFEQAGARFVAEADAAREVVRRQRSHLGEVHAKQDAEYATLMAKEKDAAARAAERLALQKRHAEVANAARELAVREAELRQAMTQKAEKLGRFHVLQESRSTTRRSLFDRINAQLRPMNIAIAIDMLGNKTAFTKLLNSMLRPMSQRPESTTKALTTYFTPSELVEVVKRRDAKELVTRAGLKLDRAVDVVETLVADERLYELECVDTDDVAKIVLKEGADDEEGKDTTQLSLGQRCATILPVILATRRRPIVLDQPESNVGLRFLTDYITEQLLALKSELDIVVATHHGNVVVLSKADRVIELACREKVGVVAAQGDRAEMRTRIQELTEGGIRAFRERAAFYGLAKDEDKDKDKRK